jgi:hypothetical protein
VGGMHFLDCLPHHSRLPGTSRLPLLILHQCGARRYIPALLAYGSRQCPPPKIQQRLIPPCRVAVVLKPPMQMDWSGGEVSCGG